VKKAVNLLLGVVTSIGGFVEVGSISTSAQAGADFGFALLWAIAVAGLLLAMLMEMSGRLASVSKQTVASAVRRRFGFHFQLIPLTAELLTDTLLLTAEIGGVSIALKLVSGVGFQWWILPVAVVAWLVLWLGSFAAIEDGLGLLGLVTLAFVVSAWCLHPQAATVARGRALRATASLRSRGRPPFRRCARARASSARATTRSQPASRLRCAPRGRSFRACAG
jgi:Mn2+/Fe2+ NRAMP family transporter